MSYDGIVTMAITEEFKEKLTLGKIEKIYQPQPEQLLFSIHTKNGRRLLFLSVSGNHPAAYLVSRMTENPANPPTFCMALRKHLNAARIVDISQYNGDRIINFDLETLDEMGFSVNRRLVIEIMGKHSNIILVDREKNRIIDSIKHISFDVNRVRQILPGREYTDPPSRDRIPFNIVSESDISHMVTDPMQPERDLMGGISGISPVIAQCIADAGLSDDLNDPPAFSAGPAYRKLREIIGSASDPANRPVVYLDAQDKPLEFHLVPLSPYEKDPEVHSLAFGSISEACEFYYSNRESTNTVRQRSADLARIVSAQSSKLKLKLKRLNEDLQKAENSDRYRLFGELLTANIHMVQPGSSEIVVRSYYDGEEVRIPLDPRFSAARNAQLYYRKYAKAKTAVKEKAVQIDETSREIDYLESVTSFIDLASSLEELDLIRQELTENGFIRYRKKNRSAASGRSKPSPYKYTLSSGLTVFAGRNNKENDWLTTKRASGSDLWFHTKDIPGSHVILFLDGRKPSDLDLTEAAQVAAYHSKGKLSSNVPVDYTLVRHVKKPSGARPGMVIFTHNKTLYVDPKLPAGSSEDDPTLNRT